MSTEFYGNIKELSKSFSNGSGYICQLLLPPSDTARLMIQLENLAEVGNTVIVVEHDMPVVAASDWGIDIRPVTGDGGGNIVAEG